MKVFLGRLMLCLTAAAVLLFIAPPAFAVVQNIGSLPVTGAKPLIDGQVSPGEWPTYALHLQQELELSVTPLAAAIGDDYPIETYVYFYNDGTYLYVLVDAVGDTTQGDSDECLLVFGLPPNYHLVEIWKAADIERLFTNGAIGESDMGFGTSQSPDGGTNHRIYEFKIRLSSLGIQAGDNIAFYSPQSMKHGWYGDTDNAPLASMPYDSEDGRDNVFPSYLEVEWTSGDSGIILTEVDGYSILQTSSALSQSIPTLNEWGLLLLSLMLMAAAACYIRKKQKAC